MANPRQRRKTRSSSHRPVKQSRGTNKLLKKQPPIDGPRVLQDAWDKHKTVRQNYAALGLAHALTPTDSGGRVVTFPCSAQDDQDSGLNPETAECSEGKSSNERTREGKLPHGFGRILRDETGAVVDVVLAEGGSSGGEEGAKDKAIDDFEIGSSSGQPGRMGDPAESGWLLEDKEKGEVEKEGAKEVHRALDTLSQEGNKKARTPSSGEIKYLSGLVQVYGRDYEGMARDRKRNVNQYSTGQLKRAIERAKVTAGEGC